MNEVIFLVISFYIWAFCIVVCGKIMRAKGRGLHFGQFIGFMLGILGIPVCLLWLPKMPRKQLEFKETHAGTNTLQNRITQH